MDDNAPWIVGFAALMVFLFVAIYQMPESKSEILDKREICIEVAKTSRDTCDCVLKYKL